MSEKLCAHIAQMVSSGWVVVLWTSERIGLWHMHDNGTVELKTLFPKEWRD